MPAKKPSTAQPKPKRKQAQRGNAKAPRAALKPLSQNQLEQPKSQSVEAEKPVRQNVLKSSRPSAIVPEAQSQNSSIPRPRLKIILRPPVKEKLMLRFQIPAPAEDSAKQSQAVAQQREEHVNFSDLFLMASETLKSIDTTATGQPASKDFSAGHSFPAMNIEDNSPKRPVSAVRSTVMPDDEDEDNDDEFDEAMKY